MPKRKADNKGKVQRSFYLAEDVLVAVQHIAVDERCTVNAVVEDMLRVSVDQYRSGIAPSHRTMQTA